MSRRERRELLRHGTMLLPPAFVRTKLLPGFTSGSGSRARPPRPPCLSLLSALLSTQRTRPLALSLSLSLSLPLSFSFTHSLSLFCHRPLRSPGRTGKAQPASENASTSRETGRIFILLDGAGLKTKRPLFCQLRGRAAGRRGHGRGLSRANWTTECKGIRMFFPPRRDRSWEAIGGLVAGCCGVLQKLRLIDFVFSFFLFWRREFLNDSRLVPRSTCTSTIILRVYRSALSILYRNYGYFYVITNTGIK